MPCCDSPGEGSVSVSLREAISRVRKRWRNTAVAALIGVAIVGFALAGLRHALRSVPGFYAQAVAIPTAAQQEAGESLERNVLALHNEFHGTVAWSAVFTDDQINGWLAADLPEKFPQLLPPEIQDPRVAFWPNQMQLAGRFSSRQLTSIVSVSLEVRLADEPNTLAVRILGARAGLIPLPLKQFLDQITAAAQRIDLSLRWAQVDGDPVALITIGELGPLDDGKRPLLEHVEVRDGELYLAGRTERRGSDAVSTSPTDGTIAPER
jgi:hypothetical protein